MPMPSPNEGETRSEFISRFMSSGAMLDDYPKQKQRLGVAYSQWREAGHSAPRKSVLKRYR